MVRLSITYLIAKNLILLFQAEHGNALPGIFRLFLSNMFLQFLINSIHYIPVFAYKSKNRSHCFKKPVSSKSGPTFLIKCQPFSKFYRSKLQSADLGKIQSGLFCSVLIVVSGNCQHIFFTDRPRISVVVTTADHCMQEWIGT